MFAIPATLPDGATPRQAGVHAARTNFMVLDEPTRHMDSANSQKLKGVFNDLLDSQLIVVTINSEFGDAAGKHFLVTKDADLRSQVTCS